MAGTYILKNDPKQSAVNGLGALRVACATYDFAKQGGAVAAHSLGVTLPKGAVVVDSLIDVITTCTTASADSGTMAIHIQSANDIVTATAVSAGGNIWDAGLHAGVPVGSAATSIKLTADRVITATIGTAAFTAGKFRVWLFYLV
jgi:hypothetical protein